MWVRGGAGVLSGQPGMRGQVGKRHMQRHAAGGLV